MSFKSAVITFPGSNCDRDALTYLKDLTHGEVFNIWHEESSLPNVDLVILPGGFSFGDYLLELVSLSFYPLRFDQY